MFSLSFSFFDFLDEGKRARRCRVILSKIFRDSELLAASAESGIKMSFSHVNAEYLDVENRLVHMQFITISPAFYWQRMAIYT